MNTIMTNPECNGEMNGVLDIALTGGTVTNDFSYEWEDGEMGPFRDGLVAGNYTVYISDDNDCLDTFSFELTQPDSLKLEIDPFVTIGVNCAGDDSASIGVVATGGEGDYVYTWTPNVSDSEIALDISVGDYMIEVMDETGCTAQLEYSIEGASAVEATLLPIIEPACSGGVTEICLDEVSGGNGTGYVYSVNLGPNMPIDSCLEVSAGPYSVAVFDSEGCGMVDPIELMVIQPDPISVILNSVPEDQVLNLGDSSAIINAVISSLNPVIDIEWNSSNGTYECANTSCSTINIFTTDPSFYNVTVTDANGCTGIAELFIDVKTTRNVFTPNIFTPDNDGLNDFFVPFTGSGVSMINYFNVYDRWGNLMHNVENVPPGNETDSDVYWDGNFGSQEAQPGVYIYISEIEFVDGEILNFKGSVTLIR